MNDNLKCLYEADRYTLSCTVCGASEEHAVPVIDSRARFERAAQEFRDRHKQCLRARLEGINLNTTGRVVPRTYQIPGKSRQVNIEGDTDEVRALILDTAVAMLAFELESCDNKFRRIQLESAIATIQEII